MYLDHIQNRRILELSRMFFEYPGNLGSCFKVIHLEVISLILDLVSICPRRDTPSYKCDSSYRDDKVTR